jgi:hypothetical protein
MADAALFIGWGIPVRGREAKALEVFGESVAYWSRLQEDGSVESVQTYLLEPHGGDLGGFALLNGEPEKLSEIRQSEEFQRLIVKAGLIIEHLGVVSATTGDALTAQMGVLGEEAAGVA